MKHPYAQKLLHQALLFLLRKKTLDKISVSELCRKAGVNRTTFYNYYTAPADILCELVRQFAAELPPTDASTAQDTLAYILTAMEANLSLSRTLSQAFPGTFLSDTILALPQISALLDKSLPAFAEHPEDKAAAQAFISAGSSRLISDWLLCDDRRPTQEEAALILSLCNKLYS